MYLNLGICVHYPKSNPYYQGRQFKKHFFQNYAPVLTDFLTSIKHPMVERWHPHVVLLFSICKSVFTCILIRGFVFNSIAETHNSVHGKYFLLDNVAPPFSFFWFNRSNVFVSEYLDLSKKNEIIAKHRT